MAKFTKTVSPTPSEDKPNGIIPAKAFEEDRLKLQRSTSARRANPAPEPGFELKELPPGPESEAKPNRRASKTPLSELHPVLVQMGHTVKKVRRAKNLTQLQVAQRCGFNAAAVFMVEAGRHNMTIKGLMAIAAALDLEVGDLFPRTTPRTSTKLSEIADTIGDLKARVVTQLQTLDRLALELRDEAGVADRV